MAVTLPNFNKHPNEKINVVIRYEGLGAATLSNPAAAFTGTPGTLSPLTATIASDGKGLVVNIGAGNNGVQYQVEATCDVSDGRKPVTEFTVSVIDN